MSLLLSQLHDRTLSAGAVDVWYLPLDVPAAERVALTAPLDAAERATWGRMRAGGDRWAVARGARRHVLARYLGVAPASLRFGHGPYGKPWLVDHDALRFSAASRGGLALLAVAGGVELGADLEHLDTAGDPDAVASDFLSPLDRAAIDAAPPGARRSAFAQAWARHEALRKLHGTGIARPLPAPAGDVPLVVRGLAAPAGYAAAVAAHAAGWRVRVHGVPSDTASR